MAGQGVNALTSAAICPQSRQPELKHAAVRLETAKLPWQVVAAGWMPAADAPAVRECLRALFVHFPYAVCVPFGRETADVPGRVGVLFRAAATAPDLALLAGVEQAFGLADGPVLRYADPHAGQRRALCLDGDGTLQAFLLAGDVAAQAWVLDLLQQGQPAAAFGRALLSARPKPPAPVVPRSPQICACHDVSLQAIAETLPRCMGAPAERLQQLQCRLRCGTECGSCLPAVKTLLSQIPCEATAA
jgi:assimilatory nitrate reductase catalytic subunit